MIGLAAKGMDQGFRIVVVLAGLKNDLRKQTAKRFSKDLLCYGEELREDGKAIGSSHPSGNGYHGDREDCWTPNLGGDVNHQIGPIRTKLRSKLKNGKTVLIVAKKNVRTLEALTDVLNSLCRRIPANELPMLIIDDEFDEASAKKDPEAPTPGRIADIWSNRGHKVAYVGYTATIQANILQDTDNHLWPRDFVEIIRYPALRDSELTFFEPEPNNRYTGGEVFFKMLEGHGESNFLIDTEMSDQEFSGFSDTNQTLARALISYFVSGAIRLLISDKSLTDPENLVKPHTMLIHTELEVEEHWESVRDVMGLISVKGRGERKIPANYRKIRPRDKIDTASLLNWLQSETPIWKESFDSFKTSSNSLNRIFPDRRRYEFPSWEEVEEALVEVFSETKLRVINSDDMKEGEVRVDGDLDYTVKIDNEGSKLLPRDIYSIVVGGNKLSRGLTLEGLCISYFSRTSVTIAEDTTVQRERWFGYRGKHLEFCRLYTSRLMAESLSRFVNHEIDLKEQFCEAKREGMDDWSSHSFRFLSLAHSTPSHALGRGRRKTVQFSPSKPFIQKVQMGNSSEELTLAERNKDHFLDLCDLIREKGRTVENSNEDDIGYCLEGQDIDVVIEILENLQFSFHNPDPKKTRNLNLKKFMRRLEESREVTSDFSSVQDPYLIAAYLKFWKNAYEEEVDCQGNNGMKWKAIEPPKFNIAIRFGSLEAKSPFNFPLMNREISDQGVLTSSWGSRGYGTSHIDEWFDAEPPHDDTLPSFRPAGTPGLALIHVISKDAKGREGRGSIYKFDRPTVALNIPKGGPAILSVVVGD